MRYRLLLLLPVIAITATGCGGRGAGTSAAPAPSSAPTKSAGASTVWLCFPSRASDPCAGNLSTTVVRGDGSTATEHPKPAAAPAIDCFYVYPTVSSENRGNSDLRIQLPELVVAQAQAEQFSRVCRVYAPMYRQITDRGLTTPSLHASPLEAYTSVLAAWRDYLAHDNHGRGVVLIGHSQGAYILKELVKTTIDPDPSARRLLVSAILLGGQVLEGNGASAQGSFAHVPPCSSTGDTGCVIAYSTFSATPPPGARFGRDASNSSHVLCVNPAAPGSSAAVPVDPLFPTLLLRLMGAGPGGDASTPWVSFPGLYTAQCKRSGTASWLQITRTAAAGDPRPVVRPLYGPSWGLHATDVNIALANLVGVVGREASTYLKRQ